MDRNHETSPLRLRPDELTSFPPSGDVLRSIRRLRRLSQRELAEHCTVARATIERIESGRSRDPGVHSMDSILRGVGFRLVILSDHNRELQVRCGHFRVYDRAQRHLPAHLTVRPIRSIQDPWWGWFRIAWDERDAAVPAFTYDRRPPPLDDYWRTRVLWQDAT